MLTQTAPDAGLGKTVQKLTERAALLLGGRCGRPVLRGRG